MNIDDQQRASGPLVHRPRHPLVPAAALFSPSARAAGAVALERQGGERTRRLVSVARDAIRERRHPTRPRMRSVVLTQPGRLDWWDTAVPAAPAPGGAVVMPLAMATCDLDRPVGLGATPFPLPLHFGHECVGEVLAVGEAVRTVRPGDRVAVPFQISCGRCLACRNRLTGNCRSVPPISMYGFGVAGGAWGGAFSEQVAVPYADAMLVPLPAGVDPVAVASVADTLGDAYRHIGPYVERIRRHRKDPALSFSAPCGVAASSAPVCRCMPRRSPARWSRRLMCSLLRLRLGYVSTRHADIGRFAEVIGQLTACTHSIHPRFPFPRVRRLSRM